METQKRLYNPFEQPVSYAVVYGLVLELNYSRSFNKIDYSRILHPENHPDFNKQSRKEHIK